MVEKVIVKSSSSDLDGAQFENAATEATLKRLVDLMEKQKPGGGAAVKNAAAQAKSQGINPKVVKDTEDGLSSISKSTKDASNSVSQISQSGKDAASNVDKLSRSGYDASKKTSSFGSALSFLASGPLALIGSAFSMITDTIGQSMDALRATGGVGASFNGSLLELNKAAASSGMSLQEYSKFVGQNSQLMANLGGTVTEGAHRMGELSKGLRTSQVGQQMMALGITTDSMNGALADYMKIEAQQGRLEGKTTAELTKGSGEYLKNLGDLSRLTGQNVDELSKQAEAMQRDEKINALMQDMTEEQQKKFTAQMQQLTAVSPELAKAFKDGMIGLGDNDLWNQLSSISPEARQLAEDMKNGRIKQDQFNDTMGKLGPQIRDKLKDMPVAARAAFEPFLKMGPISSELNKNQEIYSKEAQERAKREGEASKPFTSAMMNLQSTLSAFYGELKLTFMESGIFKRISGAVDWAATKFTELKDPMMKFVKTILDTALPVFDKVGQVLSNIVNSIMSTIAPQLPLLGRLFSNISNTIVSLIDPALDLFGTVANNAAKVFSQLLIPIVNELWNDISGLAKSIYDNLMPSFNGVNNSFLAFLPSIDTTIKVLKDWQPVIVGLIEGFIAYRGMLLAVEGAQLLWAGAQALYAGITTVASIAWAVVSTAGWIALGAFNLAVWAATTLFAALGVPVIAVIAAVVALGAIFKALYDNGWTLGSAWEAIGDSFSSIFLDLKKAFADAIDYLKSWVNGGRSEAEKKAAEKDYEAEKALYKTRADARDAKRAEVRKERGTEDSLLNISGKKEETKPKDQDQKLQSLLDATKSVDTSKLTSAQKDQMVGLSPSTPGTTTAATAKAIDPKEAERQKLIDERTNQILGVSPSLAAVMPKNPTLAAVQGPQPGAEKSAEKEASKKSDEASSATAEAVVATASKADETLKISYQQVATLNTVSDQLNTLNEVMKEILKLHHDQIDTQKDLVNVTKGKYSPL
jgi:hypothetical protein